LYKIYNTFVYRQNILVLVPVYLVHLIGAGNEHS
jgi:hypothetical protein